MDDRMFRQALFHEIEERDVARRTTAYENQYLTVNQLDFQTPSGDTDSYYYLDSGESVICLCIEDGDVLFIEIARPRLERVLYELPGGGVEDGETPIEAAKREFREETGWKASTAKRLGTQVHSVFVRDERHFVYLSDVEYVGSDPETEIKGVHRVPVDDVLSFVLQSGAEWNLAALALADNDGLIDVF